MSVFTKTVLMSEDRFNHINRLLGLDSLEDMTDDELMRAGAQQHASENVFCVWFDDDSVLNYDLRSGSVNYWDDVWWASSNGSREEFLECSFELGETIEVDVDGDTYVVCIETVQDAPRPTIYQNYDDFVEHFWSGD